MDTARSLGNEIDQVRVTFSDERRRAVQVNSEGAAPGICSSRRALSTARPLLAEATSCTEPRVTSLLEAEVGLLSPLQRKEPLLLPLYCVPL